MLTRKASAQWKGSTARGNGTMKVAGHTLKYSVPSRFEDGEAEGTNPEELIGAAHAGCFSMAFAATLEKNGFNPTSVETTAEVTLEPVDGAPTISKIHLTSNARVPGIDEAKFHELAADAKQNCPVSRLYKGAEISVAATLAQ